jgi:hypothetical protein
MIIPIRVIRSQTSFESAPVILSGLRASRSEAFTDSKDPLPVRASMSIERHFDNGSRERIPGTFLGHVKLRGILRLR